MENLESDAFVFFGATGDLAFEQIFPALQAMIRRGHFDMPIIGVARSAKDLDGLRARARESIEKHGGVDPRAFAALSAKLQYVNGDYGSPETFRQLRKPLALPLVLFITLLYLQTCLRPWLKVWPMQVATRELGWSLKSHSAATFLRRRHSIKRSSNLFRIGDFPDRPLPWQGASPKPVVLPLRQFIPRADLEQQLYPECSGHDG